MLCNMASPACYGYAIVLISVCCVCIAVHEDDESPGITSLTLSSKKRTWTGKVEPDSAEEESGDGFVLESSYEEGGHSGIGVDKNAVSEPEEACKPDSSFKRKPQVRDRSPHLSDSDYRTLLTILCSRCRFSEQTKKENFLYQKACRYNLKAELIADPYRGEDVYRLTRNSRILLPPDEIEKCITFFYKLSLGDGAAKLFKRISLHYFGISRYRILLFLNANPVHAKSTPLFKNKAPLQPIRTQQIMEKHQIDLVSMEKVAAELDGQRYLYVLSILDCFSRFLWLRPLTNKQSKTIAQKMEEIYLEFGPPKLLQSDRGPEFCGAVKELAAKLNIKMIHSRPYYPQSQGKIERSHATWKGKLAKHQELLHSLNSKENWVVMLPYLAQNYNNAVHTSTKKSPYEVMFSIKSNMVMQCFNGGHCTDVDELFSESNVVAEEMQPNLELPLKKNASSNSIRLETRCNARAAEIKMIKQNLAKYPPCEYNPGEFVLVKGDAVRKPGKLSVINCKSYFAVVKERRGFLYILNLLSGPAGRIVKVKVNKITSLTRAEEHFKKSSRTFEGSNHYQNIKGILKLISFKHSPHTGMEMLQRNALLQGLQLQSDNAGGGNCLFLAIAQQHEKVFGISKCHSVIRKEIVQYLSQNPILGPTHLPSFVSNYPSWNAYLNDLGQNGTWGDHLTLIGAANLYHISMAIISSVDNSEPIIINPEDGTSEGTILLGHIAELHYVSLQPLESVEKQKYLETNQENYTQQLNSSHNKKTAVCKCEKMPHFDVSTLEILCDHLLIYIFALATMYSDDTTCNISLVCKRFNGLVNTQEFRDKQFQEWLKRVTDWSKSDRAHREEFLYSRKSAFIYLVCKNCGKEFPSQSGWQRGPDGLQRFYWSDDFCSNHCLHDKQE